MKYLGLVLVFMVLTGFSCQAHKGYIRADREADGGVVYRWDSKTAFDAKIKSIEGDSIAIKTLESKKPGFAQKVVKEGYEVVKDAVATNRSAKIAKSADVTQ